VTKTASPRLAALDAARGAAVVAMVMFHLIWDLGNFNYIDPEIPYAPGVKLFGHAIAIAFLFIAGLSLGLAREKNDGWRSFWRRFFVIAGAAALVSAGTWLVYPQAFVFFGILHCIAAASLLAAPLLLLPWPAAAAFAALFGLAPLVFGDPFFNSRWFAWVGFATVEPLTNDYQPLAPWAAALFAGVATQKLWTALSLPAIAPGLGRGPASWLGRRSLAIYLLHQPALFAVFGLLPLLGFAPAAPISAGFFEGCVAQCEKGGGEKKTCETICACTAEKAAHSEAFAASADAQERASAINRLAQACVAERR
jgi:uncharacterized membrane protein